MTDESFFTSRFSGVADVRDAFRCTNEAGDAGLTWDYTQVIVRVRLNHLGGDDCRSSCNAHYYVYLISLLSIIMMT